MRDYGKVHTTFWSSGTTAGLSGDGQLLALYLMTSPHTTIAGVFRLPDGYVAEDLHWTVERVAQGFSELLAKGFATRCEATKWVWIVKHLVWNPPENPNQRKAAAKCADSVPDECSWKRQFHLAWAEFLGLEVPAEKGKGSPTVKKPSRNQKQEQKTETGDNAPEAREVSVADLKAEGVDDGVAVTWMQVRKDKNAKRLTQLAWDAVKREAAAVGMTPAQAVRTAAENNWVGFKASWLGKVTTKPANDPFAGAA